MANLVMYCGIIVEVRKYLELHLFEEFSIHMLRALATQTPLFLAGPFRVLAELAKNLQSGGFYAGYTIRTIKTHLCHNQPPAGVAAPKYPKMTEK